MKQLALVGACVLAFATSSGFSSDQANRYVATLKAVAAPELPSQAAHEVKQARAKVRPEVTVDVVKAAAQINPAALPAVVGAIAKATPEMAADAAGTAAAAEPKQAVVIARAAAAAAPKQAGNIVAAVCKAAPNEYRNIAIAVATAAPGSNKEILTSVSKALPDLQPGVQAVLTQYNGNVASVGPALDQAVAASPKPLSTTFRPTPSAGSIGSPLARGPAVGNPYVPLSSTPTNTTPSSSGDVPTGGRNYAAP